MKKPSLFFDKSLRAKLVITLATGILTIIGVLAFAIGQNAANLWEEEAQRQLSQQVVQSTETLNNFLNIQIRNVELWSSKILNEISANYSGMNMYLYFSEVKNEEPWIYNIYLIQPDNRIYDSFGTLDRGNSGALSNDLLELFYSDPPDFVHLKLEATPDTPAEDIVVLKRPLQKNGKTVEGHYLAVLLSLSQIHQHLFAEKQIGKNGFISLAAADRAGQLVWPTLPSVSESMVDFLEGRPSWEHPDDIPAQFESLLLNHQPLSELPFWVVGGVSLHDVREPILQIVQMSIILGVVFSVIGMIGAVFISEKISSPIRALTSHIQQVAQLTGANQLSELPPPEVNVLKSRNDEIGVLIDTFHQLQIELVQRNAQISEHIYTLNQMNEELKKTNRLKDEFLANVSHELKTPLHGIIGITESMSGSAETSLPEHYISNFAIIIASARRLHHMVDDILDSSLLKHNKLKLNPKTIDMKHVVHSVLGLSQYLLGQKDLRLLNEIPKDIPYVEADENRVHQILSNLVTNAIKFTHSGFIKISAQVQPPFLAVHVQDTGIGIPAEKFDDIFEYFIQADGTISRQFGGTGLGLAITKQLLELHGGSIHVNSTVGTGSTFTFTLPLSENPLLPSPTISSVTRYSVTPSVIPAATPAPDLLSQKQFQLLLVDDDPVNLRVLQHYLHSPHYALTLATSAPEAMNLIEEQGQPHLILLDVMMPGMSGFELCQKIRQRYPAHELPVIFLTAKNQVMDLVEGFALGGNDYISKPFSKEELLARVENQILLLQVKDQLVSLRNFTHQIAFFKSTTQIFEKAFQELKTHVYTDQALLFHEDKCLESHNVSSSALLPIAPHHFFAEYSSEDEKEVYVFNSLQLNQDLQRLISEEAVTASHLVLIRVQGLENYFICLFREKHRRFFNSANIEYIQNIAREIKEMRKNNIQSFVADEKFLSAINQIKLLLGKMLYIQAQAPYCIVVLDTPQAEEVEFRLTLQNLVTYFGEDTLFQVHRSYLVNPHKLEEVRRKPNATYEVILKNQQSQEISIPAGRIYVNKARQKAQQKA